MDFVELISLLLKINAELKEQSIRAVNIMLTLRNWFFGFYIVEFEQNGHDRAGYGKTLLANISAEMKRRAIPNTDERELRRYRQFYIAYPAAASLLTGSAPIRELLPPGLLKSNMIIKALPIRGSTPEFQVPDIHYFNLFNGISYTHFVELIRIDQPLKRLFYELECIKGTWSVKELRRQIGSLLYERTGLSKNKGNLLKLVDPTPRKNSFPDLIRDPYIFEFIGLKQQDVLPEKELEQALLDNLLQFLLELGKGFCFEARQKRIVVDMVQGDNPPVGILLCTGKDQEHVEFATAGLDDKVFVSQYLVALPDKQELEQFIKRELQNNL